MSIEEPRHHRVTNEVHNLSNIDKALNCFKQSSETCQWEIAHASWKHIVHHNNFNNTYDEGKEIFFISLHHIVHNPSFSWHYSLIFKDLLSFYSQCFLRALDNPNKTVGYVSDNHHPLIGKSRLWRFVECLLQATSVPTPNRPSKFDEEACLFLIHGARAAADTISCLSGWLQTSDPPAFRNLFSNLFYDQFFATSISRLGETLLNSCDTVLQVSIGEILYRSVRKLNKLPESLSLISSQWPEFLVKVKNIPGENFEANFKLCLNSWNYGRNQFPLLSGLSAEITILSEGKDNTRVTVVPPMECSIDVNAFSLTCTGVGDSMFIESPFWSGVHIHDDDDRLEIIVDNSIKDDVTKGWTGVAQNVNNVGNVILILTGGTLEQIRNSLKQNPFLSSLKSSNKSSFASTKGHNTKFLSSSQNRENTQDMLSGEGILHLHHKTSIASTKKKSEKRVTFTSPSPIQTVAELSAAPLLKRRRASNDLNNGTPLRSAAPQPSEVPLISDLLTEKRKGSIEHNEDVQAPTSSDLSARKRKGTIELKENLDPPTSSDLLTRKRKGSIELNEDFEAPTSSDLLTRKRKGSIELNENFEAPTSSFNMEDRHSMPSNVLSNHPLLKRKRPAETPCNNVVEPSYFDVSPTVRGLSSKRRKTKVESPPSSVCSSIRVVTPRPCTTRATRLERRNQNISSDEATPALALAKRSTGAIIPKTTKHKKGVKSRKAENPKNKVSPHATTESCGISVNLKALDEEKDDEFLTRLMKSKSQSRSQRQEPRSLDEYIEANLTPDSPSRKLFLLDSEEEDAVSCTSDEEEDELCTLLMSLVSSMKNKKEKAGKVKRQEQMDEWKQKIEQEAADLKKKHLKEREHLEALFVGSIEKLQNDLTKRLATISKAITSSFSTINNDLNRVERTKIDWRPSSNFNWTQVTEAINNNFSSVVPKSSIKEKLLRRLRRN